MSIKETLTAPDSELVENGQGALPDSPGVIVFPPLLFVSAILLGATLQLLWPIHPWGRLSRIIGVMLAVAGATSVISAKKGMRRVGTNVHPGEPTTAIVTDGPYRFTRNPIYLGATMVYLGLTLLFNAFWPLPALAPFFVLLHWGVVRREERYLEAKFGKTYLAYKGQVRRWL